MLSLKNRIKILDTAIANRIAAGEVVNRPESVVKELIENSIDANSTEITLIVKDSGKSLIQVIDNGDGMSEEDAIMCFQRHSTSKISTQEDLENIITLGFRGEALASICSVSQVELKTKDEESEIGTFVRIEGNELKETSKIQIEKGTSILVKNLFYNTPGRRNFLKSDQTEFRHIYECFVRLALSHPEISYKFYNKDELIFDLKPTNLRNRITNLFAEDIENELIEINLEHKLIKIYGFITKPSFSKKVKQNQYFYLNNRYFQSKSLNYAVYSGYEQLLVKGNYPLFFIFINIDPKRIDVNVHPSKLEVKFEDESAIFGFIRNIVKDSLKKSDLIFEIGFNNKITFEKGNETLQHIPRSQQYLNSEKKLNIHSLIDFKNRAEKILKLVENKPEEIEDINIFEHKKNSEDEIFNIIQFQNKYLICQTETGLMIIDQHAAHERILYENALKWFNTNASFSQQLLIPITLKLTNLDYQLALSLKEDFKCLGFNFKDLKNNIIELTSLPQDIKIGNEKNIFQELLDQYKEYELKLKLDKRDNLAKSFACRSAIKSGDKLTTQEMTSLIDKLFSCELPYVCPHGRPTIIRITTEELDKRFSRT